MTTHLEIPADLTIPDFLKVANRKPLTPEQQARTASQKPQAPAPAFDCGKPKSYYTDPETRAAWDAMEARALAKKATGLAALAEWKAANPEKVEEQKHRAKIRRAVERAGRLARVKGVKGAKAPTGRAPRRRAATKQQTIEW